MWKMLLKGALKLGSGGLSAVAGFVPVYLWITIILGLAAGWGVQYTLYLQQAQKANEAKLLLQTTLTNSERALREAHEKANKLSAELSAQKEKTDATVAEERERTAAALLDGAATRRLLLDATRRLSARADAGDPAALARAEQRAEAFGELLGRCDAVAEGLGKHAEDLATQVRGLQRTHSALRAAFALATSRPLADGNHVHPQLAALWCIEVNSPHPVFALDSGFNGGLRLFRKEP